MNDYEDYKKLRGFSFIEGFQQSSQSNDIFVILILEDSMSCWKTVCSATV